MRNISQMEALVHSFIKNKHAWVLEEKITGNIIGYITVDIYHFLQAFYTE